KYFLDGQVSGVEVQDHGTENDQKVAKPKAGPDNGFLLDITDDDIFLNRHHGLILIEFTTNPDEFIGHVWKNAWLPQMADKKKLACPYIKDEQGRILLTGASAQLHKFVERLPVDAFDPGEGLTRIKASPAPSASTGHSLGALLVRSR